jgi:hypothetical protein
VRRFVERGGALLLIADHMPMAGAASDLGLAFGVHFENGFALGQTSSRTRMVGLPRIRCSAAPKTAVNRAFSVGSCFRSGRDVVL